MAKIDVLLDVMIQNEASDLHISAGAQPMLRIDGELQRTKYHDLSPEEVEILLFELMDDEQLKLLKEKMDIDFAYEIEDVARFRANVFMERNGYGGAFRLVPTKISTIRELNLPESVQTLASVPNGLILITRKLKGIFTVIVYHARELKTERLSGKEREYIKGRIPAGGGLRSHT